jgi:hypothetical protein
MPGPVAPAATPRRSTTWRSFRGFPGRSASSALAQNRERRFASHRTRAVVDRPARPGAAAYAEGHRGAGDAVDNGAVGTPVEFPLIAPRALSGLRRAGRPFPDRWVTALGPPGGRGETRLRRHGRREGIARFGSAELTERAAAIDRHLQPFDHAPPRAASHRFPRAFTRALRPPTRPGHRGQLRDEDRPLDASSETVRAVDHARRQRRRCLRRAEHVLANPRPPRAAPALAPRERPHRRGHGDRACPPERHRHQAPRFPLASRSPFGGGEGRSPLRRQLSMKLFSCLLRDGWRSLRSALASIWRIRSRVTSKSCPTSSRV